MIIVTGTATASRETLAEMIRISLEHVRRSRTEEGCISHNVHIDCENPMRLMFFEQWADEETLRIAERTCGAGHRHSRSGA